MDDDFFSDDETFGTLEESELAALEENALNSTQPPQVQRPFNTSNRATIPTPTLYRTPHQQPQKQQQQALHHHQQQQQNRWGPTASSKYHQTNTTNFGPTTVPTLQDVNLQNSQSGRGYHQIPPAEYDRYDETAELRDTTEPQVPYQEDAYCHQGQYQQVQQGITAQDDENYGGMEYDANDLDELLGAANHSGAAAPMASGNDGQWGAMGYQQQHQEDSAREQGLQAKIMEVC